ncbi:lipocalin-like domain-containing protein, partial [Pseudomonas syringae]|uniref:lipocalin-like domain-containing protein n=1 Tax=Pseudomonas syringae TaxID=317 RepID=UPI001F8E4803
MRINLVVLMVSLLLGGCDQSTPEQKGFAGMGNQALAFTPVVPGRVFSFPADHGAHDGFRIEWWYVTANLKDQQGNQFGVQWTLFRSALKPLAEQAGWADQTIWLGHAAVTSSTVHHAVERYARGGVGQAGVQLAPFEAWIDDWRFASQAQDPMSDLQLSARDKDFA